MRYAHSCILLCLTFLTPFAIHAQHAAMPPKYEVRAVWLTTLGGIDWPRSHDAQEQQQSLRAIVRDLKEKNFNTIYFQARSRGNAFYHSRYEPWAEELTGTAGKDPGWDPLAFLLVEAHAAGMEVHAWLNMAKVYGDGRPHRSIPAHVLDTHPSWVKKCGHEWWIDMGIPTAREYLKNVVLDVALAYDVDGIHFDYLRYPDGGMEDWDSFRTHGNGMKRDDWRRSNLDRFVTDVYRSLKKQKPHLKIGSAPIGLFQTMNGVQSDFTGYAGVYQDARGWLRKGVQDYLVPQLYWDLGAESGKKDPDFEQLCAEWTANCYGRHIYAGIGVYKKKIQKEVDDQIFVSRLAGVKGQALFRYRHLEILEDQLSAYRFPALIPPMPWIDSIPPLPPSGASCTSPGVLRWSAPEAARDGDMPDKYVIYRSSSKPVDTRDPRNIIAILAGSTTSFVDRGTNGRSYSYVVTSLDACNNESRQPSAPTVVATSPRPAPVAEKPSAPTVIATSPRPEPIAKKPSAPTVIAIRARPEAIVEKQTTPTVIEISPLPEPIIEKPTVVFPVISSRAYVDEAAVHTATNDTLCLLAQNYPDPFTEKTLILYQLAEAGHVRLIVTDPNTGRKKSVVDEQQEAGTYIALFTGMDGIEAEYECRLEVGDVVKRIVMKQR